VARSSPSHPVGIDLGTTLSVVAHLDPGGRPVTMSNVAGEMLTPSAILVDDAEIVVGREAVKGSVLAPQNYGDCFKRDMGRQYFRSPIRGIQVPPEVLSAMVLEYLKEGFQRKLGPVTQVVITVPAYFDERRRRATQEAGRLAGLEVLDIINEPTAAAVAYGFQSHDTSGGNGAKQRVLVYDLGGGTFDVTVLEMEGWNFRTLATDGDVQLGGRDFDERIFNHLAEKFLAAQGRDPRQDPQDTAQLLLDAREAKHALSDRQKTNVAVSHAGIRMRIDITRKEFEALTSDLLGRTELTCKEVIREAKLEFTDLDKVLLVGGSSRMPMVGEMLIKFTGKTPDRSASPDEAVAHGAALYCGMLMRQGKSSVPGPDLKLTNVNPHSLGVVGLDPHTRRRTNVVLIPKNTALPAKAVKVFRTAKENQQSVQVAVVEGESPDPDHCIQLGQCVLRNLPTGMKAGTPIEVRYAYAANGRLAVEARMPTSGVSMHVELEREQAAGADTLAGWKARLQGRAPAQSPTSADGGKPITMAFSSNRPGQQAPPNSAPLAPSPSGSSPHLTPVDAELSLAPLPEEYMVPKPAPAPAPARPAPPKVSPPQRPAPAPRPAPPANVPMSGPTGGGPPNLPSAPRPGAPQQGYPAPQGSGIYNTFPAQPSSGGSGIYGQPDPGNSRQRLDDLYRAVGRAMAGQPTPPMFQAAQMSIAEANNQLQRAQHILQTADIAARQAQSMRTPDYPQRAAELNQAMQTLAHWQSQADAAISNLGRQCVDAGLQHPQLANELMEIQRLRQMIGP